MQQTQELVIHITVLFLMKHWSGSVGQARVLMALMDLLSPQPSLNTSSKYQHSAFLR
jgi:hypothetical protein